MPKNCAVLKCSSSSRDPERKFFRFPVLNHKDVQFLATSQTRQDAWLKALNRADFFPHQYKNAAVCDLHFTSGKSAALLDVDNVDWAPTWNLGYKIIAERPANECSNEIADPEKDEGTEWDEEIQSNAGRHYNVELEINGDEMEAKSKDQETQTERLLKISVSTQTDSLYTGYRPISSYR